MNGFFILYLVGTIFAIVVLIPLSARHDRNLREMEATPDEHLNEALTAWEGGRR